MKSVAVYLSWRRCWTWFQRIETAPVPGLWTRCCWCWCPRRLSSWRNCAAAHSTAGCDSSGHSPASARSGPWISDSRQQHGLTRLLSGRLGPRPPHPEYCAVYVSLPAYTTKRRRWRDQYHSKPQKQNTCVQLGSKSEIRNRSEVTVAMHFSFVWKPLMHSQNWWNR